MNARSKDTPKKKQAGEPNWKSKTIWTGDCLDVMRGMNSESVDLIYLDPPFNSKADYAAPIGSKAAGAAFKDTWTLSDVDIEWVLLIELKYPALEHVLRAATVNSDKSYLIYMAIRILEMHRILRSTGSIYLHCDPTMSHYLKILMDAVFGPQNFRDEIVWQRAAGRAKGSQHASRSFGRDVDYILHFSKGKNYLHNEALIPLTKEELFKKFPKIDEQGRHYHTGVPLFCQPSMGARPNLCYTYNGITNPHPSGWRVSKERLAEMDANGEIIWRGGKNPQRKSFAKNYKGKPIGCLWTDIPNSKRVGYPTEKPLPLLHRIIAASSNPDDMVLDPFCGCATSLVAAHDLKRKWVGIDISSKAAELVVSRIADQKDFWRDITHREDIPQRTDLGKLPPYHTHKQTLYGAQKGNCLGCGEHFKDHHLEVDHIISRSKGGTDHIENLQLLCSRCNRVKGTRGMEYLKSKLRIRP